MTGAKALARTDAGIGELERALVYDPETVAIAIMGDTHDERIAARFLHELPRTVRFILRPTGALNRSGSNLASYLLFERSFCRALIELGYQDTARREAEVRDFFDYSEGRAHA